MSCDVSVVIPTYNSSGTIRRALDSIFFQSMAPCEVILVDDASSDWRQTQSIAESYALNIPIHFIRMAENSGPSAARNKGISMSSGRYLSFLDSDDVWFPEKLKCQYEVMDKYGVEFSTHDYVYNLNDDVSHAGNAIDIASLNLSSISTWHFLFHNHATPTVMVQKERMIPFDLSFRRNEDWKCWIEVLSKGPRRGKHIRHSLAGGFKHGVGSSGLSQNVRAMHISRMLALKDLVNSDAITFSQYLTGMGVEAVKYPIRSLRVALRR